MTKFSNEWSRRKFLTSVGKLGGSLALYETMVAMGLVNLPTAWAGIPTMRPNQGEGKSVLILGAGIGGLTAAFILSQYGYRCRILEATSRAGGRNHTARKGTMIVEESKANGTTYQECMFDEGLYMNLGPGRLPYHHRRVLGYCQELNVALQPYIMNTTGNLFQANGKFDSEAMVYRGIQHDTRGYISEMLAKVVNKGLLDQPLDGNDKENLLSLLKKFGALNDELQYVGTTRDGCGPDPNDRPTPNVFYNCLDPLKTPWKELLDSQFWNNSFYSPLEFEWQPTLFQPVGGMDMIVEGFLRKVGNLVEYNAPVSNIDIKDECVKITIKQGSKNKSYEADYCISNIPCSVLKDIPNNFTDKFASAVKRTEFADSCKVGWQCNTRFWENDQNEIYGGISWTDDMIEQIWYPSADFFGQKGTLTGAYIHGKNATAFGTYDLKKRLQIAKAGGAKMHKEFNDNSIVPSELGLSIAWQNIPYLKGAWPAWNETTQHDNNDYQTLLLPDKKRFFITGDQASTLPGWQEGAMMSAEHVVELLAGLKPHVIPEGVRAPNTLKIT
ncbi:MAG: FAD-dependent oxidoreductase, partial [Saprospiraceae bacterium]